MWGTGVFAADSKRAGPLPVRVADQSKPVAPDADKATVKTLLNQLFEAQQSGKTQTVQDTRDKLNALREKLGDEKFKAILEQLKKDADAAWLAFLKALFPELFADESVPPPSPAPPPPSPPLYRGFQGREVDPSNYGTAESMSDKPFTEGAFHADYKPDKSNPGKKPGMGKEPGNIWSGFCQGPEGNCVTVSAIKAAMMKFGQKPTDIFKDVRMAGDGYEVQMRDGFQLYLSRGELQMAARQAGFKGNDPAMMTDANFLYAASAKRAQMENNDGRALASFFTAMQTLNDGEWSTEALDRLGLKGLYRSSSSAELAGGGVLGVVDDGEHSMAVIGGRLELWGGRAGRPDQPNAFALI
ncbi:hypothetical protein [Pseudomonas orientalis]|uniref:hypothetical protein n=1 Tax=Pseudomonas orientalis TaxID=76758 RepID=UPI003207B80E